jgi:hypothetical protein
MYIVKIFSIDARNFFVYPEKGLFFKGAVTQWFVFFCKPIPALYFCHSISFALQ